VRLEALQFGSFQTGVLASFNEGGEVNHYAVAMVDGVSLAALKVGPTGNAEVLQSILWEEDGDATVRLRRAGDQLYFEYREDKVWQSVHTSALAAGTEASEGGLFVATDAAHTMRVAFDFAILVDPGTVSVLQKDLRVTEIMYNPSGGQDLEYIEMQN
ncbi:MAG: hypothetical protein ACKVHP_12765, partial [Verrucomicrobiales bacterium]